MSLNIDLLRRAQASILDPANPFDMQNWHECVAGHICRAAGVNVEKIPYIEISNRALALAGAEGTHLYRLFVAPTNWFGRKTAAASIDTFIEDWERAETAARLAMELVASHRLLGPALSSVAGSALEPAAQSRRARAEEREKEHAEEPELVGV